MSISLWLSSSSSFSFLLVLCLVVLLVKVILTLSKAGKAWKMEHQHPLLGGVTIFVFRQVHEIVFTALIHKATWGT